MIRPENPKYSVALVESAVAASAHHLVIFNNNPNFRINILAIALGMSSTAAVTGFAMNYRVQKVSSPGAGGTALTPMPLDSRYGSLPPNITIWSKPTTAPTLVGAVMFCITSSPEDAGVGGVFSVLDLSKIGPLRLYNGEGITIRQYATTGAGAVNISVIFELEPI